MLSKTTTDVLSECEYERVRMQLHQALRGNGNPTQGTRIWQAGRRLFDSRAARKEQGDVQHDHHASN